MWIILAAASAFFAGVISVLSKIGMKNIDSNLATALRTIVVLVFSWLMALIACGSFAEISAALKNIDGRSFLFLILSGLATGSSWLCYFRALKLGDVNKVVPIDKTSTVLTMLSAFLILGEAVTFVKVTGILLITAGTFLMIERKFSPSSTGVENNQLFQNKGWLVYALLSAFFASLTSIFGKIGIDNVNSSLGTAVRTTVVLIMAWIIVYIGGKNTGKIKTLTRKNWVFIVLSGIAAGLSWLCYYAALKDGVVTAVAALDKLSVPVAVAFSYIVFKEKLSRKGVWGLALIVAGTLVICLQP